MLADKSSLSLISSTTVTTSTIPVVNGLACAAHRRHVICASLLLSWDLAAYPLEAPGEIQDGQVRLSAKIDQACDYEPLRSATPVSALVLCRTWSPDFAQFLFRALPKPYTRNFRIIGIGILPHLLPLARCRWSTARSRLASHKLSMGPVPTKLWPGFLALADEATDAVSCVSLRFR